MTKRSLIAATSGFAVLLAAGSAGQAQDVGVNSAVRNIVQVKADQKAQAQQAKVRERVRLGNSIRTAQDSGVQMLLLDRSGFTLGPNGAIVIDRFVYDPARKVSAVGASIAKGAFRFVSGKPTHAALGQTTLRTPTASIGIRGTLLEGAVGEQAVEVFNRAGQRLPAGTQVDPNNASFITLRGPGPNARNGERRGEISVTAGGQTVILTQPGQAVFVPTLGGVPFGPFSLTQAGYASLDAFLRTSPVSLPPMMRTNTQSSGSGGSGGSGGAGGAGGAGGGLTATTGLLSLAGLTGLIVAVSAGGSNSPG